MEVKSIGELVDLAPQETQQFIQEYLAMSQNVQYGKLVPKAEIFRGKTVSVVFSGYKRHDYNHDNQKASVDIGERLADAIKSGGNTTLTFQIKINKGLIRNIIWLSEIERHYAEK